MDSTRAFWMVLVTVGSFTVHHASGTRTNIAKDANCTASNQGIVQACSGITDGRTRELEAETWKYQGSANGSWVKLDFEGSPHTVVAAGFAQLHLAAMKNFKRLLLSFSDGSEQTVDLTVFDDGYHLEVFDLTPVSTTSIKVTVVASVGSVFKVTTNGFVEIEIYEDTSTAVLNRPSKVTRPTTRQPITAASTPHPTTTRTTVNVAVFNGGQSTLQPTPVPTPPPSPAQPQPNPVQVSVDPPTVATDIPSATSETTPSTPTTTTTTTATTTMTTTTSLPTMTPSPTPPPATPTQSTPLMTPPTTTPPATTTTTPAAIPSTPAPAITTIATPAATPLRTTAPTLPAATDSNPTGTATTKGLLDPNVLIYIIVAVVATLLVVLVIIFSIYCARRRRHAKEEDEEAFDNIEIGIGSQHNGAINTGFDTAEADLDHIGYPARKGPSRPIRVEDLLENVAMLNNSLATYREEFVSLPTGLVMPADTSKRASNMARNRFNNIIAYDHSRVVLDTNGDRNATDYINANFVDGYKHEKAYIATQGPINKTVQDFWRMIWQYDCPVIIMVTNMSERGRSKCDQYWPDEGFETYGQVIVHLTEERHLPDYVLRKLEISKGDVRKTVVQYHMTSWPDEGVPQSGTALLEFQDTINNTVSDLTGPTVVHCSAGVGRTGTYIAINSLRKQALEEGYVDVLHCLTKMRQQRLNMVQSLEQYRFIYNAVLEALYCGQVRWSQEEFIRDYYNRIGGEDIPSEIIGQFKVLDVFKPPLYSNRVSSAIIEDNSAKNRSQDILPADDVRPHLFPLDSYSSNYVNAVCVEGPKKRDACIVTQMPLPNTIIDIWRLVFDFNCYVVITLNDIEEENDKEESAIYWPRQVDEEIVLKPFRIMCTAVEESKYMKITSLEVSFPDQGKMPVTHVQLCNWPSNRPIPSDLRCLIELYKDTIGQIQKVNGPVLMQDLNGCDQSGLTAAMFALFETIDADKHVDVFNAVKRIRKSRPQFVSSLAQYQTLYRLAKDYLESLHLYSNDAL